MNRGLALLLIAVGFFAALSTVDIKEKRAKEKISNDVIALGNRGLDVLEARYSVARAIADVPPEFREKNWGTGSCVHATTVILLRWQGLYDVAEDWRRSYSGGEATAQFPHTAKMEKHGLKYVVTTDGDLGVIDWAIRTRRGCGIAWPSGHCVALIGKEVHVPNTQYGSEPKICAVILDNNHIDRFDYIPWSVWVGQWQRLGGYAFAFTNGKIPPPVPRTVRSSP